MNYYKHKKKFGQHFLNNEQIASQIIELFYQSLPTRLVLEIGPGDGVLTKYLIERSKSDLHISEIDHDLIEIIEKKFHIMSDQFIKGDFLKIHLEEVFTEPFSIIGNFPYNISTEIIFKILENKEKIPFMLGMFQKEVADRIVANHGSKVYGITSVLTQAYFDTSYLLTVNPSEFTPPPKVVSAVISLTRKMEFPAGLDEKLFYRLVKAGFNQRRKTLRNALKPLVLQPEKIDPEILSLRAEQLSVERWIDLTHEIKLQQ